MDLCRCLFHKSYHILHKTKWNNKPLIKVIQVTHCRGGHFTSGKSVPGGADRSGWDTLTRVKVFPRRICSWLQFVPPPYSTCVKNWSQFFTCVRYWYQFFTCVRYWYKFFTRVRNWYQFFTRQKLSTCEIWAQILPPPPPPPPKKKKKKKKNYRNWPYVNLTFSKCDVFVPILLNGVKFTKCEIYGSTQLLKICPLPKPKTVMQFLQIYKSGGLPKAEKLTGVFLCMLKKETIIR